MFQEDGCLRPWLNQQADTTHSVGGILFFLSKKKRKKNKLLKPYYLCLQRQEWGEREWAAEITLQEKNEYPGLFFLETGGKILSKGNEWLREKTVSDSYKDWDLDWWVEWELWSNDQGAFCSCELSPGEYWHGDLFFIINTLIVGFWLRKCFKQ